MDQSRDQRKSYRCAVDSARQTCEFEVGSHAVPAKLLDESAGGFSVLVHDPSELTVGQTARLCVNGDWFHVGIVHIQEVVHKAKSSAAAEKGPRQDADIHAEGEGSGTWFRLGLRRLSDTELPAMSGVSLLGGVLHFRLGRWRPHETTQMIIYGVLLAMVIVAVPLGVTNYGWRFQKPKDKDQPKQNAPAADETSTGKSLVGRFLTSPGATSADATGKRSAFEGGSEQPPSPLGDQDDAMLRLPGAAPFLLPEVIERLQLTDQQQKLIKQLIEAVTEALRKLEQQFSGEQRQQISQQRAALLDEARRQATELLTEQQRDAWKKLSGEAQKP